jgi:TPR repeat protein
MVIAERVIPLADLVDACEGDDLPLVADMDPYHLGATPTDYGDRTSYGERDPYVARTSQDVDLRVRTALQPGRMAILVGPTKAGKTRTAFEAVRDRWPQARLLAPVATALSTLAEHPRVVDTSDALIVWLDDLQKFMNTADALSPALLARLVARPGPTVVVATLRTEELDQLDVADSDQVRDARLLLEQITDTTIELTHTSEDADEQAAARAAYPDADLSSLGLAEQLAAAPALRQQYRDARHDDPILHSVLQTAVDWVRVGMPRPLSAEELIWLLARALPADHLEAEPDKDEIVRAIEVARTPPVGAGRVAALTNVQLPAQNAGYLPFEDLVAADDQIGSSRAIPTAFWNSVVELASPEEAFDISLAAYQRGQITTALLASRQGAIDGHPGAMFNLGFLLAEHTEPAELDEARSWYEQAANAGHPGAMNNLGVLLAEQVDPPELEQAYRWYHEAAAAGNADAMFNLGNILAYQVDAPELEEACNWYEQAANAGHTDAMFNLARVLATQVDPPQLEEARRWCEQAANAGHTDAMFNLGRLLATQIDPPRMPEARHWYEEAAKAGHTSAMFNLGNMLAYRVHPPQLDEACRWYEQAANAGHVNASFNLAGLLADRIDPPDLEGARRWYEQATAAGHVNASFNLAGLLADRIDPPDLEEARRWYEQAANAGHADAMFNLGFLLANLLDPPELEEAGRWYDQAAKAGHSGASNGFTETYQR